jgi:hypothetical protein
LCVLQLPSDDHGHNTATTGNSCQSSLARCRMEYLVVRMVSLVDKLMTRGIM